MAGRLASVSARSHGAPIAASPDVLPRFGEIAGPLEQAAAAISRLDALLAGHPLTEAWIWRTRLEAVRRHAAADGRAIDPWRLAAVIEGVRFRMDRADAIIERGAIFEAARHALAVWSWLARPDEAQSRAIERAAAALSADKSRSPLLGAALAVRTWLDPRGRNMEGSERPALRAALARHWQHCGLMHIAAPLLTGARAFRGDAPRQTESWIAQFLAALAEEAQFGIGLLRSLEREWFAARSAVRGRRRDSHAAAAVDVMAASPVVSATSLAGTLHIAIKNAASLLDDFVARGIALEVTHRSKRRLFGLKHLAPLREEALPPRRARRRTGPTPGGETAVWPAALPDLEDRDACDAPPLPRQRALSPMDRQEFEFSGLDEWMREAEQVIRRSQAILDQFASPCSDAPDGRTIVAPHVEATADPQNSIRRRRTSRIITRATRIR